MLLIKANKARPFPGYTLLLLQLSPPSRHGQYRIAPHNATTLQPASRIASHNAGPGEPVGIVVQVADVAVARVASIVVPAKRDAHSHATIMLYMVSCSVLDRRPGRRDRCT